LEKVWRRVVGATHALRLMLEGNPHPTLVGTAPLANFAAPFPKPRVSQGLRWVFAVVVHAGALVGVVLVRPSDVPPPPPPSVPVLFYPAPALPPPVALPDVAPPPPPPPSSASPRPKRVVPEVSPVVAPEVTRAVNTPVETVPSPAETEETPPVSDDTEPASGGGGGAPGGVPGGVAGGVVGGTVGGTGKGPVVVQAVKKTIAVQPARVLTRVDPAYPPEAKAQRLEGRVMLMVVVGLDGRVTDVRVLSGPPLLARAAAAAVAQWTYTPGKDANGRGAVSQVLTPMDFKLR
jgi:protein TonB